MDEDLHLLHTPPGLQGSGRVRYGAAMALYAKGLISEAQLDAYRDASPFDGRDPALLLEDRRLPPVPGKSVMEENPVARLFEAARDYVTALSHPGASEVKAGLARATGPQQTLPPQPHPIVARWLGAALQALAAEHPVLARRIEAASPHLRWINYEDYPRAEIGESFADGHAFAPIMGEGAPIPAEDFEMGLFLIAPHVLYRDHHHKAPELYAPLTGPHGWRFGPNRPLLRKPAHEPVWNPAYQPHLTLAGRVPFLCIYVWTADTHETARVLPAADWAALEAIIV